jgi:hypothetical protein
MKKYFFPVVLLIFLSTCSNSAPDLAYVTMRLVYFQGNPAAVERYTVFAIANDEDGVENLADLYLYHDREGLRWHLSDKDWVVVNQDGKTWIGSRSIANVDDDPLPRGLYRVVLVNKGGEQTSKSVTFDAPSAPRYPFPTLSVLEGKYSIVSKYPAHSFICHDEQGNFVQAVKLNDLQGEIAALGLNAKVRAVALWAEDEEYYTSALTDAAAVK